MSKDKEFDNVFESTESVIDTPTSVYEFDKSKINQSMKENLTTENENENENDDNNLKKLQTTDDEDLVTKNPFHFFIKKDFILLIPALITNALCSVTDVASTIMINKLFKYLTGLQIGEYTNSNDFMHDIKWPCFGIILIGLGTTLFGWMETSLFTYLGERQQIRCREKLYESLLSRNLSWFENNSNLDGDLIQLNRSIEEFRSSISEYLSILFKSVFSIISLIIISMFYSWKLTLLFMSVIPIIFLTIVIFGNKIERWSEEEDKQTSNAISTLDWNFTSFTWIKIIYSKDLELHKFNDLLDKCEFAFRNFSIYANIVSSVMKTLALLLFVQSFWFGSYLIRTNQDQPSDIISSFYSCLKLAMTISHLSVIAVIFQKANTSFKKVVKFLLSDEEINEFNKTLLIPDENLYGDIKLDNIVFKYNTKNNDDNASNLEKENTDSDLDSTILKNVSLHIEPFRTTYLIGKSGSGKSTIANILLKLYNPSSGLISIDGYDLQELDTKWLRSQITLVQQFPKIFNDTIANNILLGTNYETIDTSDVLDAVEYFNLTNVIENTPNGYQTKLGKGNANEKNVQFSGGEEQRLNLIKAKLRNSSILILDESISALDIQQREIFMDKIYKWRENKTTIIITHELSHIRSDDMVFFIEHGEIVEKGLKNDLIANGGKFQQLENQGDYESEFNNIKETKKQNRKSIFEEIKEKESLSKDEYFDVLNEKEEDSEQLSNTRAPILIAYKLLISSLSIKYKLLYLFGLFVTVCETVLTPVFSFCFSKLINGIIPKDHGLLITNGDQVKWSMIATAIAILTGLLSFIATTNLEFASARLSKNLQSLSLVKILNQNIPFFEHLKANELSTLLMNDIRDFRKVYSSNLARLVSGITISIVCIIWTLVTGWKYALVGFSMFPLFAIFSFISTLIMQKAEFSYKDSLNDAESVIYESRVGIKTIMCLNVQDHFREKFTIKLNKVLNDGLRRSIAIGFSTNIIFILVNIAQSIMLYYGFKLVADNEYTLVQMMQIIMMILMSVTFLSELMSSAPGLYKGLRVALKLDMLIFKLDDNVGNNSGYLTPNFKNLQTDDCISFKNVSFSYPSDTNKLVLKDFNMDIPKNQLISIVGESGCGKSTVMSLILRLYSLSREHKSSEGQYPESEEIKIDGYDIETIKMSHFMNNFGVVTQKHYFFNGTIKENLLYGNPMAHSVSDDDIWDVLNKLGLNEMVQSLEKQLDAPLCKSGNVLVSGGQAQRLSIARALLRPSNILLMDECTASLDAYSYDRVIQLLSELKHFNKTIICITHQAQIMKKSDVIFVIENCKIAESGDYETLLGNGGFFYKMINSHSIN